ncbi:MAG: hypothetical protein KKF50_02445 [Nanoarchaeota archaeon]|nr:hypothetical protein [Nanoarchaeota archaeon]
MKLIKHYTTKDKKYYKYELVIPNKAVEEAGLSENDELKINVKKGKKKILIEEDIK